MELKTVNPVVFDDPEFCCSDKKYCDELYRIDWVWYCHVFKGYGIAKIELEVKMKEYSYGNKQLPLKCQECKNHFQKAKKEQKLTKSWRCGASELCAARDDKCNNFKSITNPGQCLYGPYNVEWKDHYQMSESKFKSSTSESELIDIY